MCIHLCYIYRASLLEARKKGRLVMIQGRMGQGSWNGEEKYWACWSRTERDRRQDWNVCTGKEEEGRIGKRAEGGRGKEKEK